MWNLAIVLITITHHDVILLMMIVIGIYVMAVTMEVGLIVVVVDHLK